MEELVIVIEFVILKVIFGMIVFGWLYDEKLFENWFDYFLKYILRNYNRILLVMDNYYIYI